MYPTLYSVLYRKTIYRDRFVCQFLVNINHRDYILTKVKSNEYFLKQNFETMALYSEYDCFPSTYEIKEKLIYITEYKRKTLPLRRICDIPTNQLGFIKI